MHPKPSPLVRSYNINVTADRSAIGVAALTVAGVRVAYVTTATGKIYAFNIDSKTWLNNGRAVYNDTQGGTLRAIMLSPTTATPSATPTTTSTATLSEGATASSTFTPSISNTASPSSTRSSTASMTVSPPGTPSGSNTPSNSPTPTPSSVNVLTGAAIVVARVATGVAASITTPLLLDALSLGAAPGAQLSLLGTVSMPMLPPSDPSQMRLTVAGTDTRWGGLSRSGDGRMLCVAGIDAAAGSTWATVRRTVGSVLYDGSIDVSATFNTTMYTTGIYGAASVDGSGFWAVGGSGSITTRGVWYITARGTSFRNTSIIW